jgi:hypothetical protein
MKTVIFKHLSFSSCLHLVHDLTTKSDDQKNNSSRERRSGKLRQIVICHFAKAAVTVPFSYSAISSIT